MAEVLMFISDCRECPDLYWDFKTGRFNCIKVEGVQIDDLHLIPDWCPLTSKSSFNRSGKKTRIMKKIIE